MKKILIIFCLISTIGYAQQDPIFTQYYINDMIYNPAITGSKTYNSFSIQTRQQWLGFDGAPLSSSINYHGAINNRSAMGGSLVFDKTTPSMQGYLQLNYAYHVPLDYDRINISFGIGAKISYFGLDFNAEDLPPGIDPAYSSKSFSSVLGDAASGVYLYGRNFYLGYSINNLLESSFQQKRGIGFGSNNEYRHYYGMAGYRFNILNKDWSLEPSILFRQIGSHEKIYDLSTRIAYLNNNWLGMTYRTNGAIAFAFGFLSGKNMHISYSYDHVFSGEITQYTLGTHEIVLNFKIPSLASTRHISFWNY